MVKDGRTVYHGANDFQISGDPIYKEKSISAQANTAAVRQIITDHQQGKGDFITFCNLVAAAGVNKWMVDIEDMCCSYYDLFGGRGF